VVTLSGFTDFADILVVDQIFFLGEDEDAMWLPRIPCAVPGCISTAHAPDLSTSVINNNNQHGVKVFLLCDFARGDDHQPVCLPRTGCSRITPVSCVCGLDRRLVD